MRAYNSGARWALFDHKIIMDLEHTDEVYLSRWRIIQTPWFGVLLHRIYKPDWARELHNHPWSFMSLILTGGYTEECKRNGDNVKQVRRGVGSVSRRTKQDFHRISELHGTVRTFVLVGRRRQEWGFLVPSDEVKGFYGYVGEADYKRMKAAEYEAERAKTAQIQESWDRYQEARENFALHFDPSPPLPIIPFRQDPFHCPVHNTTCVSSWECDEGGMCRLSELYSQAEAALRGD